MIGFPKFTYIRSKPLLEACRHIPCQHCSRSDGTVVAAHSNQARHGKGRSIKASDVFCAALCYSCHMQLDQGRDLSREDREQIWQAAFERTVQLLVALNLWPAKVPIPDITSLHHSGNSPVNSLA
jgi:hypothetical protein